MGTQRAWFQFTGIETADEADIRTSLIHAGLDLCVRGDSAGVHGILCFQQVTEPMVEWLREFRGAARGMVLALGTSPSSIGPGDAWRLLRAGASDALVWSGTANVCRQVKARIERWNVVDALVESARSRLGLIGGSLAWKSLLRRVAEAAAFTTAPILLIGESGTGKELLAQTVHLLGSKGDGQSDSSLETVDCSTLVPDLSGSELFGHERGAFTGAVSAREGAFERASGGTLFLDEVGELPSALQPLLLRGVQEKTYKRVGGNVWHQADFRLVCATNRDLADHVERGHFRLDLYHRLAGWIFRIPPLRERREDVIPLAAHFLEVAGHAAPELDASVREYLVNRDYPGNVRELRQLAQRIAHTHVGQGPVTAGDIPEEDRPAEGEPSSGWPGGHLEAAICDAITMGISLNEIKRVATDMAIRRAIQSENGNLPRAAKRLGVTDRALQMRRAAGKTSGEKTA